MNNEITNASKPVLLSASRPQAVQPAQESSSVKHTEAVAKQPPKAVPEKEADKEQKLSTQEVSLSVVKTAAATGNSILQATNRNLEFQVDDSSKKVVVKIIDSQSGKVLRQIPSEEMMAFINKMQKLDGDKGSVLQDRA